MHVNDDFIEKIITHLSKLNTNLVKGEHCWLLQCQLERERERYPRVYRDTISPNNYSQESTGTQM